MNSYFGGIRDTADLPPDVRGVLCDLIEIYEANLVDNQMRGRYYDQKITVGECNLGIALPSTLKNFQMACCWPEKAVTALADRSKFDGFVNANGESMPELDTIVRDNKLVTQYNMSVIDELKHGGVLATLSPSKTSGCNIRFHSFASSAARWNGELQRIDAALAIIDGKRFGHDRKWRPTVVNLYTEKSNWVFNRTEGNAWKVEERANGLGRVMANVLRYKPTNDKPLGSSRITRSVMDLTRGYIRTMTLATIGLEYSTSPQKYLLGVSDAQYDALIDTKFARYIDSMLLATVDPDTGQVPQFGQLAQGTLQPHMDMLRMLSTQFASNTCLSVTDTGVINDANPTSADALAAQNDKLIRCADDLNVTNGEEMREIALMALAVSRNQSMNDLSDDDKNVMAHFLPTNMVSQAAMGDWAVKMAQGDEAFAGTDVYYEMQGFDKATIARIQAQKRSNRGLSMIGAMVDDGDNAV